MIYHVSKQGNDSFPGTEQRPFLTIGYAASVVKPGDTVQVHEGEYREWVDLRTGGLSDDLRITFEAAPGEHPVIKGSEVAADWEQVKDTVWKKMIHNSVFGAYNPFLTVIDGDWFEYPRDHVVHYGDVYLNGRSMYEAKSLEDLYKAEKRYQGYGSIEGGFGCPILDPDGTVYQWYAEPAGEYTALWCNFGEFDPNTELVEISVRKCCFYPTVSGVNYITLRGFEICQAACPYIPPTSEQFGMVGPGWSRGWIIENNHLHDAKCSAVSLGKNAVGGDHLSWKYNRKSSYTYQLEAVYHAYQNGWNKENIGSHIVRNNRIHDCGQNGVVGNLGSAFCRIENNHIYNIDMKREFWCDEMAGIKFHAAIDTVIVGNRIHNCSLGTWLDWQSQGTRVTKNLYYNNDRDFMIEVTHGPCLIDNNVFMSDYAMIECAQGTALVHNLFLGTVTHYKVPERATPYHFPHSTTPLGFFPVWGGDDRFINNIFVGKNITNRDEGGNFCQLYDEYTTPDEYRERVLSAGRGLDSWKDRNIPQPMLVEGNVYSGHARPWRLETAATVCDGLSAEICEEEGKVVLTLVIPDAVVDEAKSAVSTERLGRTRLAEEQYENPDGTPIDFTLDYFGNVRTCDVLSGPFAVLEKGVQKIIL